MDHLGHVWVVFKGHVLATYVLRDGMTKLLGIVMLDLNLNLNTLFPILVMAAKWPEIIAQGIIGNMFIEVEQDPCKFFVK